jgi:hypothetical protein
MESYMKPNISEITNYNSNNLHLKVKMDKLINQTIFKCKYKLTNNIYKKTQIKSNNIGYFGQ